MVAHCASGGGSIPPFPQPGGRHFGQHSTCFNVSPSGLLKFLYRSTHGLRRGLPSAALRAEETNDIHHSVSAVGSPVRQDAIGPDRCETCPACRDQSDCVDRFNWIDRPERDCDLPLCGGGIGSQCGVSCIPVSPEPDVGTGGCDELRPMPHPVGPGGVSKSVPRICVRP